MIKIFNQYNSISYNDYNLNIITHHNPPGIYSNYPVISKVYNKKIPRSSVAIKVYAPGSPGGHHRRQSMACLLEHLAGIARGCTAAPAFLLGARIPPAPKSAPSQAPWGLTHAPDRDGFTLPIPVWQAGPPWHRRNRRSVENAEQHHARANPLVPAMPMPDNAEGQNNTICETNLHIANHISKDLYTAIKQQYIPLAKEKIYSLGWMFGLNGFLYDKIAELFNDASYLKNTVQFADIIMIKNYIENNIDKCIKSVTQQSKDMDFYRDYFNEYKKITDFFPRFSQQMDQAMNGINFTMISELIDVKNGLSYDDAKKNLQQQIKDAPEEQAKYHKDKYAMLLIMQEAHLKYEKLLFSDSISLIDKIIYFNTREFYLEALAEQPSTLGRILIRRFFYYIFEYSRNNGLSMQGNYLIIPGELTEYRGLFDMPEPPLNEEEIAELLANQIEAFIQGSDPSQPHIGRLVRDIEFYRTHPATPGERWQADSLRPYNETLQYLEKSVATNLERIENPLYAQNLQWVNNLFDQIKYDKECILLLSFLEELQIFLIDVVEEHQHEQVLLGSKTDEQRLVESKIQAMNMAFPGDTEKLSQQEMLNQYFIHVNSGDVGLLLRAAIYWYIDYHHVRPEQLSKLNSLFIFKDFQEAKKLISHDFEARHADNYNKIFNLKPSTEFNSSREFFLQFNQYKEYSLQQEAKTFTYKTLAHAEIDYLDMIYPPKEVFTFKIYSRNYVSNSLSPNSDIFEPNNNFGTFSLIRTYSHKWIMTSSLFSAPFVKEIPFNENSDLLNHIMNEHKQSNFNVNWNNRRKIPISTDEVLRLFDLLYNRTVFRVSPLSLFLIEPEEDIVSFRKPDYVLVAGKGKDEYNTLIEVMDYWNAQLLEEIITQLKKSLRIKKWWQELLALIPFYEILWKEWNDPDNKIDTLEVIFDTFDLAFMLMQLTKSAAKGSGVLYKRLLEIAHIDTMPIKQLNRVVSKKLVEELPSIARKSSGSIVNSLFGYLNPLPIHTIFSKKVKKHLSTNMASVITWTSNFILNNMEKRMTKFILWSADIDKESLMEKNNDGIFILEQGQDTTQNFIQINDHFFQVIWDAAIKSWRVVKPTEVINSNCAIPMYRNDQGKWAAAYFLENDRFPLTTRSGALGRRTRHLKEEADMFNMEPLRGINFAHGHKSNNKGLCIFMLELMLNDYTPHMKELFDQNSDISKMLTDFSESLKNKEKFNEVFKQGTDDYVNTILRAFITGLITDAEVKIAYRMLRLWQNEHDRSPVDHIVIALRISNYYYIVDMVHLRPYGAGLIDDRQVFTEPEWAFLIKKTISSDYPLIKYKDFTKIKSAIAFPYNEAGEPGKFVRGALLLRQPIWYTTAVIKYHYRYDRDQLPIAYHHAPSILSAARSTISSFKHHSRIPVNYNMNVTFPFLILNEAKILDNPETDDMRQKVTLALGQNYPNQGYMSDSIEIMEINDMLKIKPGKLLAIFYDEVFLSHLLLSVGDGRFAGVGNNLFDPLFDTGPSIILAEEMGFFADGKLTVRNTSEQYTLLAGNPFNAPANETVMVDRLAYQTRAQASLPGEAGIGETFAAARERILTQSTWTLVASGDDPTQLTLKMEAVPDNIYPLDTGEMAHIIRGLLYIRTELPALARVQCIDIITVFDGVTSFSHRGQTLANELRVDIQLRPYLKTDRIKQRQPHWSTRFSPATIESQEPHAATVHTLKAKDPGKIKKKLRRFADMIEMLITIRKSMNNARIKRNVNFLPAILSDIARLIIRDMNFYEFTGLYRNQLDSEDEQNIYHILREYQDYISEGDEFYLQCYFDILLSVNSLRPLAEMIYPMPAQAANHTLPLWPYA